MTKEHSKMIRREELVLVSFFLIFGYLFFFVSYGKAATLALISDTISTSNPARYADHRIKFKVTNSVPAGGRIVVTFEPGKFEIPASFDYRDVDLLVDDVPKSLGSAASDGVIGVNAIPGANGSLTFILGGVENIASGSSVIIKAGRNASFEHAGMYQIKNPLSHGSYPIAIKTYDALINSLDQASTRIMILESVRVSGAKAAALSPPSPPVVPAPSGAAGGGAVYFPSENRVTFCGRAYPGSAVYLLKDGMLMATVQADPQANFDIMARGLSRGVHNFGLYTKDKEGRSSVIDTYPVFLSEGVELRVCGLFFAPTIALNNDEIRRGEILTIFGQSAPDIELSLFINSENDLVKKTKSDKDGLWAYNLDTAAIEFGEHTARARARKENEYSNYSEAVSFVVGKISRKREEVRCLFYDLNCDERINLVDFSIMAYWWKRPLTAEAKSRVDFNGDGKLTLVDFSILAFHWNG